MATKGILVSSGSGFKPRAKPLGIPVRTASPKPTPPTTPAVKPPVVKKAKISTRPSAAKVARKKRPIKASAKKRKGVKMPEKNKGNRNSALVNFLRYVVIALALVVIIVALSRLPKNESAVGSSNDPSTPTLAPVAALPNAADVDGWKTVRQDLPSLEAFRDMVVTVGDDASGILYFGKDYDNIVLLRAVPDDMFTSIFYFPADGSEPVNLLPLLDMQFVVAGGTGNADTDLVLCSRAVNIVDGEILQQNMIAVQLGTVQTGSYVMFQISDDPELGVNNGTTFSVSADSDPLTVDLNGNLIAEPTFIPESCPTE